MRYFAFLFFTLLSNYLIGQNPAIDSLQIILKSAKEDTNKVNILYQLSEEYSAAKDVLNYAQQALSLAEKLSTSSIKAIANAGKKGIANASNNIGYVHNHQGDIPKALEWYHKSLKIREEIGDKSGIGNSLNNLGFIYLNQGDITKAMEYFQKGLKILEEIGDKKGVARSIGNIAGIYSNQGDKANALVWFDKSLKIQQEIGDLQGMARSLNNIGSLYGNKGEFDKALEWFHKSLKIYEENDDKFGVSYSLNNIGGIYLKQNNYKRAKEYCCRALLTAKEIGYPEDILHASKRLSTIYKALGNYKEALEMHELFKLMADSINNVETRKSGLKKQMQYDFEKKENATKSEQEKKDVIAQEELQRQKVVRNSFIGGFALVLILALVVLRSYRQKRKTNIEITAQKHTIEEKQKEILDSIHYAKRIQTALITSEKYISKTLNRLMKI